jgi:hypothetical protein
MKVMLDDWMTRAPNVTRDGQRSSCLFICSGSFYEGTTNEDSPPDGNGTVHPGGVTEVVRTGS